MQARGVRASLRYPSTSAICTWARTWLVIAMLPRVLYVYWGFHSWWCSRQRGGLHGLLIWRFPQKGCP